MDGGDSDRDDGLYIISNLNLNISGFQPYRSSGDARDRNDSGLGSQGIWRSDETATCGADTAWGNTCEVGRSGDGTIHFPRGVRAAGLKSLLSEWRSSEDRGGPRTYRREIGHAVTIVKCVYIPRGVLGISRRGFVEDVAKHSTSGLGLVTLAIGV